MFRIAVIAFLSLAITLSGFLIVMSLNEGESLTYMIYIFILVMGGAFFPALIAAFIFYLFIRKRNILKASTREKIKVSFFFILTCELGLILWAVGEWLIFGDLTWREFIYIYKREFNGWNLIVLIAGSLMSFLYFTNFLRSPNSEV